MFAPSATDAMLLLSRHASPKLSPQTFRARRRRAIVVGFRDYALIFRVRRARRFLPDACGGLQSARYWVDYRFAEAMRSKDFGGSAFRAPRIKRPRLAFQNAARSFQSRAFGGLAVFIFFISLQQRRFSRISPGSRSPTRYGRASRWHARRTNIVAEYRRRRRRHRSVVRARALADCRRLFYLHIYDASAIGSSFYHVSDVAHAEASDARLDCLAATPLACRRLNAEGELGSLATMSSFERALSALRRHSRDAADAPCNARLALRPRYQIFRAAEFISAGAEAKVEP